MSVVRMKRSKGVIIQDCDVYIGRACNMGGWHLKASPYANPYKLKDYSRDESLRLYEQHIRNTAMLWDGLLELKGKVLGCWCDKDMPCHGHVLLKLIKEKEQLS